MTITNFEEVETSGPGGTVGLDILIDMMWVAEVGRKNEEIVRGWFLDWSEKVGRSVPTLNF